MSLGTVLVIGGSSGIGLGVATELVEAGSRVVIAGSTDSKVKDAVAKLNGLGKGVQAYGRQVDLSNKETIESNVVELLRYAISEDVVGSASSKLNHIIHTAGDALSIVPMKDWSAVKCFDGWNVRFVTALALGKHGPDYLVPGPEASITFTTGSLGQKPNKNYAAMVAQVGAIETFARGLAVDLAPVRVNVVSTGTVQTPLLDKLKESEIGRKRLETVAHDNLLMKIATVKEAAQPYLYFLRDTHQTGTVLQSDGGRMFK